jgi:prepilin peptidase CpaA
MEDILQTIILLVGIVLFIVAAYSDVKSFRIPNKLVAAIALLAVTRLIVLGDPTVTLYTVGASAVLLVIGFVLFWQGFIGGGDAKLITAAALLVGYHDLFTFLFLMSLCGGLASLVTLVIHRYVPLFLGPTLASLVPARLSVPYGAAIAGGGIVTLLFQSSFIG